MNTGIKIQAPSKHAIVVFNSIEETIGTILKSGNSDQVKLAALDTVTAAAKGLGSATSHISGCSVYGGNSPSVPSMYSQEEQS